MLLPPGVLPAAAQTCWVAPGLYVDTDTGDGVAPGLVMNVAGMPCWADVRLLALPGQPFDPYTRSLYEDQLTSLDGPPPYDKPNGCPYAAGEFVDMKDQYDVWYPGIIASASRDCSYSVDYWVGQQQKSFGAYHADLRASTLPMPKVDPSTELGPNGEPRILIQACTNGAKIADLGGEGPEAQLKRAMLDAVNTRRGSGANFSVAFESLVEGEGVVASPGSDVARRYQDAASGAVIRRYRMVLSLCEEDLLYGEPPSTVRYRYDQSCYDDIFGDLVCAIDNTKSLQ